MADEESAPVAEEKEEHATSGEKKASEDGGKKQDSSEKGERNCLASCCLLTLKGMAGILLIPVIIALILVAIVVWVITLPLKCCSPCFAPCLSALTSFVELLAKIPYKLLRWMCYLGSDEDDGTETAKVADGSDSKEYGSTN